MLWWKGVRAIGPVDRKLVVQEKGYAWGLCKLDCDLLINSSIKNLLVD